MQLLLLATLAREDEGLARWTPLRESPFRQALSERCENVDHLIPLGLPGVRMEDALPEIIPMGTGLVRAESLEAWSW